MTPRRAERTTRPGQASPLGATPDGSGTNFALLSEVADAVELCLFHGDGEERIPMSAYDAGAWHVRVDGVGAGQRYGFRVTGPWDPARGQRCNPAKLLLDPYARATSGTVRPGPELVDHDLIDPDRPSGLDSAPATLRSLVVDGAFDWGADEPPRHRLAETVLYELHVKGFTQLHPEVPAELRGTYAGLAHEAVVEHLVGLGVTAVELMPVHEHVPEPFLLERGLTNYWGYNTIGFFAPHAGYSAAVRAGRPGGQVDEFKAMVRRLHDAGLEVVLDVVFNHTAEAGADGPTLCHRGIDNESYYRLDPSDPSRYVDTTGCGNTLDAGHPTTLRLIMDSLRYWVSEMHVDGFRFDLAPSLARQDGSFSSTSAFLDLVEQDPIVNQVKLFAEPWDVGRSDSYDLGRFPRLWSEWNGSYRDTVRDFWRGADGTLAGFATRITGSSDLFGGSRRRPTASVNLVTVHDGFTLHDLVSYERKHNEANGEDNRDGNDDNRSSNGGIEGPTDDAAVVDVRGRRARAMITTLLTSFGVPLLLAGDESGRTQGGNNNAYCQDNEISWVDWHDTDVELLEFVRRVVRLRRDHPVLRRRRFLSGVEADGIEWFRPDGQAMSGVDWTDPVARCVALLLDGDDEPDRTEDGVVLLDDDLLLLFNGWVDPVDFVLPERDEPGPWHVVLDSARPGGSPRTGGPEPLPGGSVRTVDGLSVTVLEGRGEHRSASPGPGGT